MKSHRFVWIPGIAALLLAIVLLPDSAQAVTSGDPPPAQSLAQLIDAGTLIIFFSICGVVVIGLGVGLYFLVRWLRKIRR